MGDHTGVPNEGLISSDAEGIEALSGVLIELLRSGEIKVLLGHWADDNPRFAEGARPSSCSRTSVGTRPRTRSKTIYSGSTT